MPPLPTVRVGYGVKQLACKSTNSKLYNLKLIKKWSFNGIEMSDKKGC